MREGSVFEHHIKFNYLESEDKKAPPVLMLHGFMGSSQDFSVIATFIENDFRCISIDLPGHGETIVNGSDDFYSMEKTAAGIIEFISKKNINKVDLIAYSMGGRLGLYLVINYPKYFDKVILESTSPGLKSKTDQVERIEQDKKLAKKILNTNFNDFIEIWYRQPLFASLRCDEVKLRRMIETRKDNSEGYALSLLNMGTGVQPSLWGKLKNIKTPTLLIAGELDVKFKTIAKEMAVLIPGANLNIIPNAGHNVHFEMPEIYVETVNNFLNK